MGLPKVCGVKEGCQPEVRGPLGPGDPREAGQLPESGAEAPEDAGAMRPGSGPPRESKPVSHTDCIDLRMAWALGNGRALSGENRTPSDDEG